MKSLLVNILLFTSASLAAQQDYVVTLKKDTIYGKISLLQNTFYDEVNVNNDDINETLKSYQVLQVNYDGELYEPIPYANKKVFGRRVVKGALSHYMVRNEGEFIFHNEILLKEDGNSLVLSAIGFRKRLAVFVKECDELVDKVKDKDFGYSDIGEIVEFYNANCGK